MEPGNEAHRDLGHTAAHGAQAGGWVIDAGTGDDWECVAKAHHNKHGIMKSTKRMRVEHGYLYQVTTEGPKGYAEALTFVPCAADE